MSAVKKIKGSSPWPELDFNCSMVKAPPSKSKQRNKPDEVLDPFDDSFTFSDEENPKIRTLSGILQACAPKEPSELVVSKQKQNEIIKWLDSEAVKGEPRILILSGPSGCGKTAALKVLAEESGFELIEWLTPINAAYSSEMTFRQSDKFMEFLVRATRYNSVFKESSKRLLLVKDIPNIFFFDKECFHSVLRQYMEMGKRSLIFICADSESSKIMNSLFPPAIIEEFSIAKINIHSATQTAMKNMMKRISGILNKLEGETMHVTQAVVDEVLSNCIGDVRSCILNVIFSSIKVPNNIVKSDCETREESLGLLHAIGRVINPKRINNGDSWKFTHDPDEIAAHFLSQSMIFLHFLQENYVNTMATIEQVAKCSEIMTLSDIITSDYREINLGSLSLSLSIRGVMVSNETPLTKWNPVKKPRTEKTVMQRDLGNAEERYYKEFINSDIYKSGYNSQKNVVN